VAIGITFAPNNFSLRCADRVQAGRVRDSSPPTTKPLNADALRSSLCRMTQGTSPPPSGTAQEPTGTSPDKSTTPYQAPKDADPELPSIHEQEPAESGVTTAPMDALLERRLAHRG
jgi:hypothetical protein